MKKLILILTITILVSCSEDSQNCDIYWKVEEWCEPKVSGIVGCQTHTTSDKRFCEDDLKGVTVGTTIMYSEDINVKRYRKFLEKL